MKPQNCWIFWNCPKEKRDKCPAFIARSGKDCFNLAKDFRLKVKNEYKYCSECAWYKTIHGIIDDEIYIFPDNKNNE